MSFMKRAFVGLAALAAIGTATADFDGPAPIAWRWADRITARPSGSPTIVGDHVFAAVGSRMYCLERESGNQVWRFPAGEPLQANFTAGAAVAGDLMIAAADDKSIYAVNTKTGEMAWQYIAPDGVFSRPVVVGTAVVFGLASNQILALGLQTGQPIWDAPYAPTGGIYDSMTSWNNSVIFLTSDGMLTALDVTTKRPAWRPRQFTSVSPLAGITVYGDNIFVSSGVYLTSLTASTGRVRFETIVPGTLRFNPAVGPEGIVVVTEDGRMHSFTNLGRPAFRTGIDLGSAAAAGPAFTGDVVAIPTSNGSLNLLDPFSGQVLWNFTVPPMVKGMKVTVTTGGGGGAGGGAGLGGAGGSGGQGTTSEMEIRYVTAAGPAVSVGDTLVLLAEDGSILAFDKGLGVDLTPPDVSMVWPNPGDQVSGRAPMELIFLVTDVGSGVRFEGDNANYEGLKVTVNGNPYIHEVDREGRVRVKILTSAGPNFPLADGRARITVAVADWMGNSRAQNFVLTIDNTLPALGSPRLPETGTTGGGPGAGGSGGRGGGGSRGGG
jgi:outer membrane protein assembly factor BamB